MPVPVKVVSDGTYAVLVGDVSMVYKGVIAAVPPSTPARYLLTVVPKGIGKPQSPQLTFAAEADRDAFYDALVTAMS